MYCKREKVDKRRKMEGNGMANANKCGWEMCEEKN
jgi:hypothetical protein